MPTELIAIKTATMIRVNFETWEISTRTEGVKVSARSTRFCTRRAKALASHRRTAAAIRPLTT